ncbi:MAG: hypothetical protein GFH27_549283n331 [Chloroflexi bacterium AL-W]|nr:hypothetical protein [Chloroflexi bacterium AL-N1]NOK64547.1 hypothetical protein [Chloroflexi bacterium AL-N10]NOK75789.1 hypothetical protein [Chloroflexi bacterium AL-N5]NOK80452.1 hypothetical protein [Chloroflexi bacterium AL-W]NOK86966.1 hypothetical protein [Chloroflexi bacterium AL-N15]
MQRLFHFCTHILDSIAQQATHYACILYSVLVSLTYRLRLWGKQTMYLTQPGQGLTEYGLILVLIMVVCVVIIGTTGETISEVWYQRIILKLP